MHRSCFRARHATSHQPSTAPKGGTDDTARYCHIHRVKQQNTTAADSAPTIKRYDTLASEMIPCEEEIRVTSYDDENTVTAQLLST